jgi:hypothetical protein
MPYITQEDRKRVDETQIPKTQGELNYLIHTILEKRLKASYSTLNDLIGALDEALDATINFKTLIENQPQVVRDIHDAMVSYIEHDAKYSIATNEESEKRAAELTTELKGVARCIQLEIYRRIAAPYEEKKKEENGDISFYSNAE